MSSDTLRPTCDPDETEVPAPATASSQVGGGRCRRSDDLLRVGPFVLPVTMTALFLSVAGHASVLLIGLAVMRVTRETPPSASFSRGDGGSGGGFFMVGEPGGVAVASLPPPLGGDMPLTATAGNVASPEPPDWPQQDDAADAVQWDAPPGIPPSEQWSQEPSIIGVPDQWAATMSAPRFRFRSGGGGGLAKGVAAAPGAERNGEGNGTSHSAEGGTGGGRVAGGVGAGDGTPGTPAGIIGNKLPAPVYPRESRLRGEEGTVVLEVDVAADGSVTAIRVIEDCPFPRITRAAMDAMKKARFSPATRDGVAVPSRVRVPFRFALRGGSRDEMTDVREKL